MPLTASISPARLQQLAPDGGRTRVAAVDIAQTGDPLLDAQLALAVVTARHPAHAYIAVDDAGVKLADETDPTVQQLVALLRPEISRLRDAKARGDKTRPGAELAAQYAALAAIGRPVTAGGA